MNTIISNYQKTASAGHTYVPGIDGLRAISVISVLVYHIDQNLLPGGFVGVDIFFVISGFVVSMATRSVQARSFRQFITVFYRRRMVRILPAALMFLLATQLAVVLLVPTKDRLTTPDMTAGTATIGLSNVVLWMKAGDYFSPDAALNPFMHTWSLAVEEQFYTFFPFFALLIFFSNSKSRRRAWGIACLIACSTVSLAAAALIAQVSRPFAFFMLPTRFWELAVGIVLFAFTEKKNGLLNADSSTVEPILGASLFGLITLVAALWLTDLNRFPFPFALVPVLAASVMIYTVSIAPMSQLSRALSLPIICYFGRISYSLYLWHWSIIVLMQWTVGLETIPQKLFAVATSLALADLSYRLIEKPVRTSDRLAGWHDGRIILLGLVGVVVACVLIGILTVARPLLTLSVTGDLDVWLPSAPGHGGKCQTEQDRHPFAGGGIRYDFVPKSCGEVADTRHLYVVGDSHAGAYQRLVGNIVRTEGLTATILTGTGCALLPMLSAATDTCATFIEKALAAVVHNAKSGDVLFLPGLRMQRYQMYGESELHAEMNTTIYTDAVVTQEAQRFKAALDAGMRVVLEAPKPVHKYAPMRCSDWFNQFNPHCREKVILTSELQTQRDQVLAVYERLRSLESRLEIWDPFPLLCPSDACLAVRDSKPLVTDGDHLSGYANDYLTPFFIDFLKKPRAR